MGVWGFGGLGVWGFGGLGVWGFGGLGFGVGYFLLTFCRKASRSVGGTQGLSQLSAFIAKKPERKRFEVQDLGFTARKAS